MDNLTFLQVGDTTNGVVARVDVFENGLLSSAVNILGDGIATVANLVDLTVFTNVTSIRIYAINDPGGLGWDDFTFTVSAFTPIGSATTGRMLHGIAFDGTQWHSANFTSGWDSFDTSFLLLGSTTVPGGPNESRGFVYDSNAGTFFVGDVFSGSTVFEVTPGGTVLNSFPSGHSVMNAIAFNPLDDTLWVVDVDLGVRHLTRTGAFLGSFSTGPSVRWTGAAFDPGRNTLLLLESNSDQVYEYDPSGSLLGIPANFDVVPGNGQGLHYDHTTGILHVTGISLAGDIAILQRSISTTTTTSSTSSTSSTTTTSTSTTSTTLLPPEGDFDGNSQRDAVDFVLLAKEVLEGDPEFPPQFDLDADDLVEFVKLLFSK